MFAVKTHLWCLYVFLLCFKVDTVDLKLSCSLNLQMKNFNFFLHFYFCEWTYVCTYLTIMPLSVVVR